MVKSNAKRGEGPSDEDMEVLRREFEYRVNLRRQAFGATQDRRDLEMYTSILPADRAPPHPSLSEASSSSSSHERNDSVPRLTTSPDRPRAVAFDVDLSGSQLSETPFLRPITSTGEPTQPTAWTVPLRMQADSRRKPSKVMSYKICKKARRLILMPREVKPANRAPSSLIDMARKKILESLEKLAPESVTEIKNRDPSGQGRVNLAMVRCWLEEHPDVANLMTLTPQILEKLFNDGVGKDDSI